MEITNKNHKIILPYSLPKKKNLKIISKNKDLENLIQDINNINNKILRYNQIEKLIKNDSEKQIDLINIQKYTESNALNQNNLKEKKQLFGDLKQLCNKVYSPKLTLDNVDNNSYINNIKPYKNSIKEVMNNIFKKSNVRLKNRLFPISHSKTKDNNIINLNLNLSKKNLHNSNSINISEKCLKNRNNSQTDRIVINDYNSKIYPQNVYIPKTIETDRKINVSYGNYASNKVKYNHPQFYVLDSSNSPIRKKLPPINTGKVKTVDLLRRNRSNFNSIIKKRQNKYANFFIALKMKEMIKFKVNNDD